jgi:hypothetical protein
MRRRLAALLSAAVLLAPALGRAEVDVVRIPQGAGGIGFLPLLVMEKKSLIEQKARQAGISLRAEWIRLGGPAMVNDLVIKYATFMADIGTVRQRPGSWRDMFFPEVHGVAGN